MALEGVLNASMVYRMTKQMDSYADRARVPTAFVDDELKLGSYAARLLANLEYATSLAQARRDLKNGHWCARVAAMHLLVELCGADAAPDLVAELDDPHPLARWQCVFELARLWTVAVPLHNGGPPSQEQLEASVRLLRDHWRGMHARA